MKKILILGILNFFIITIDTNASAIQTLKIASDSNVDWSANGITWQPSALCWVSSGWPIISDANWIWRTQFTDPIWEYDNVPSGGWFFKKSFILPNDAKNISGVITIAVDNSCELSTNDIYQGNICTMTKENVETWCYINLSTFTISNFSPGENVILIKALNQGRWGDYSTNPAGLIFKAVIEYESCDADCWKALYENCQAELETYKNPTTTTAPPTNIELSVLDATPSDKQVILKWKTETETENAGFNVWRADNFVKINPSLIPALGSSVTGSEYDFIDEWVLNGKRYFYLLEDIDTNGISTFHGPIKATPRWIYGVGK